MFVACGATTLAGQSRGATLALDRGRDRGGGRCSSRSGCSARATATARVRRRQFLIASLPIGIVTLCALVLIVYISAGEVAHQLSNTSLVRAPGAAQQVRGVEVVGRAGRGGAVDRRSAAARSSRRSRASTRRARTSRSRTSRTSTSRRWSSGALPGAIAIGLVLALARRGRDPALARRRRWPPARSARCAAIAVPEQRRFRPRAARRRRARDRARRDHRVRAAARGDGPGAVARARAAGAPRRGARRGRARAAVAALDVGRRGPRGVDRARRPGRRAARARSSATRSTTSATRGSPTRCSGGTTRRASAT